MKASTFIACYTLLVAKRVLIISAAIGGGHVAAARALHKAFIAQGAEATHVDLLDYTTAPFRRLYRQAYFDLVRNAPEFVDWLGKRLDRTPGESKTRQAKVRARLTRLISFHLPRLIKRYKPDVIVHTHFIAPEILSTHLSPDLLRRSSRDAPVAQMVVITDFFAHSLWFQPGITRYFVASEEVAAHLRASGVAAERIEVSGIPIDPVFTQLEPKTEARAALDYPQDRDVVLIMAGGLGSQLVTTLIGYLKELRWPVTVTLICGRSPELTKVITSAIGDFEGLVSFDVLGYSEHVARYMSAADLLIGKPGGLTSSETLAAALPFAIVQPYPLQEEANTSYLLENGAAMRIEPLSVFNYKVRHFLETPTLRQQMQAAAATLAKPDAAATIATSVLSDPGS